MTDHKHIKGNLCIENGTYVIRARVPDPKTRRMKHRSKSTGLKEKGNNKRKAEQAMREIVAKWEEEANRISVAATPLFSEYVQKYLNSPLLGVRANTLQSYRGYADKHILPELGDMPIGNIKRQHIQAFYNSLIAKGLKPNSVRKIGVVASGAAHLAVMDGVIPANIFKDSDLELPKGDGAYSFPQLPGYLCFSFGFQVNTQTVTGFHGTRTDFHDYGNICEVL